MAARFNPPPGWPPAPEGWTPPPGWAPDPAWPPLPPGWQLWIDDAATTPGAAVPPAPPAPSVPSVPPSPSAGDHARFAAPDGAATQKLPTEQPPTQQIPPQQDAPSFDKRVTAPDAAPAFGGPAAFSAPAGYAASAPAPGAFGAPGGQPQPAGWPGGPTGPDGNPPTGGKQWLIPVIIAVVALLAIFGVLFATGVLGGDDSKASSQSEKSSKATEKATAKPSDEPSKTPSSEPSETPSEPTPAPAGANGTRAEPLAAGAVATFSTWTVSMGAANQDAWGDISAVASEYDAPEAGTSYVMAPATVTFTGEDRSSVSDMEWVFVSAAGTTYDEQCNYATLPEELDLYQELYTDASAAGNLCVTVPTDQVAGGVWRVEMWWEGEEAYFALS